MTAVAAYTAGMTGGGWGPRQYPEEKPRPRKNVVLGSTHFAVVILLTFLIGWCVGQMMSPAPAHTPTKHASVQVRNAQKYADWCGGYVTTEVGGPYVVGCDR